MCIFGSPDFSVSEETDGVCENPNSSAEWLLLEQHVLRNHPDPGILFLSHLDRFLLPAGAALSFVLGVSMQKLLAVCQENPLFSRCLFWC